MTILSTRPPKMQEVAQAINQVVQPAAQTPVVNDLIGVLALTIPAGEVVRRIFWSLSQHVVSATKIISGVFPVVPETETRRYHNIWFLESAVARIVRFSVAYPQQGVVLGPVGGVVAELNVPAAISQDALQPGNASDRLQWQKKYLDVFPGGQLSFLMVVGVGAGDIVTVKYLWERLAPPATARADDEVITFTET